MSIYENKNNYIEIMAYYALYLDQFQMEMHRHHQCEIMYVVSGCCTIVTSAGRSQLKERQFIFLDADIAHQLLIEEKQSCSLLNLEFRCREDIGGYSIWEIKENSSNFRMFLADKKNICILEDTEGVCYALKDFINFLERDRNRDAYMGKLLFHRMILELANCRESQKNSGGQVYLKKAKEYIHRHMDEEIYVEDIAKECGINHSYLQMLFSRSEHCGINSYINGMRMEKSSFLLKNSQMPITDIAFEVGYNSRQHFGYVFQKYFEMSPQKYRKLFGQNICADTRTMRKVKNRAVIE